MEKFNPEENDYIKNLVFEHPEKGEKGDRGDQGEHGEKGDKGEDGKQGGQGIQGEKGDRGIRGIDGEDGKEGKEGSPDKPEEIAKKLNTLKGAVDVSVIKGAAAKKDLIDQDKKVLDGMAKIDGRIKLIDQRWGSHGGGGLSPSQLAQIGKVKIDSSDTTADYLAAKIVNGTNTTIAINGSGGNETIQINVPSMTTKLLTTTEIWVDGNRSDTYTASGSIQYPYKSISAANTAITTLAVATVIHIAPATYVEGAPLTMSVYPLVIDGNGATLVAPSGVTFPSSYDSYDFTIIGNVTQSDTSTTTIHNFQNGFIQGNVTIAGLSNWSGMSTDSTHTITNNAGGQLVISNSFIQNNIINKGIFYFNGSNLVTTNNSLYAIDSSTAGSVMYGIGDKIVNLGTGGGINLSNGATTTPNELGNVDVVVGGTTNGITAGTANTVLYNYTIIGSAGPFQATGTALSASTIEPSIGVVSVGYNNTYSGKCSSSFGSCNVVSSCGTTAFGYTNNVSAPFSSSFGNCNVISSVACCSTASGYHNLICGNAYDSSTFGFCNTNSGYFSSSLGSCNCVLTFVAAAQGTCNTACGSGNRSAALGICNTVSGYVSSAVGNSNTASGYHSQAYGWLNTALGINSIMFGTQNSSHGNCTVAMGANTASGYGNMTYGGGVNNNPAANCSVAVGINTSVSGYSTGSVCSMAFGINSRVFAVSNSAHASCSYADGYSSCVYNVLCGVANGWCAVSCAACAAAYGHNITNTCAASTEIGPSNAAKIRITNVALTNNQPVWTDSNNSLVSVNSESILSTTTNINGKTVANTALYTVPAGKTCIVTGYTVRVSAASAITVGPAAGIGNVAGTNNISASQAMNLLTSTTTDFLWPTVGMSVTTAAAGVIYFNLGMAATGTSETLLIDLWGYNV